MEQTNEMDFLDILKTDYYEDNQYLYLNNKQRVNLKEEVNIIIMFLLITHTAK